MNNASSEVHASNMDPLNSARKAYLAIYRSLSMGMVRFLGAEAASARLNLTLLKYKLAQTQGEPIVLPKSLEDLDKIPPSSFDALTYVTTISHLVYATALLDTFLNETTIFLFLHHPEAMGRDHQLSIKTLLEATSRSDALTKAAKIRAREISYKSFADRVQFVREKFGLRMVLSDDVVTQVMHFSSLRNASIHDQGIFDLTLNEQGHILHTQKTCSLHPTPLSSEEPEKAAGAYRVLCREMAKAVMVQVLKLDEDRLSNLFEK